MDIYDFLNPDKPVVRRTISGGTTNGRIRNDAPSTSNRRDDFANKEEYAEEYIEANKQQMLHVSESYLLSINKVIIDK